jgi:EpsI family protein
MEWGLAVAVCGALAYLFAEAFSSLAGTWDSSPMYSYGIAIPFISLYLVWGFRERIRDVRPCPSHVAGWPVLASGLLALVVGKAGGIVVLQELALIPTLTGVVLITLGWPFLKTLWIPIIYLLFMIPVWDGLTERLHEPFQNFSAGQGMNMLGLLGIPAYRDGIFIELPNLTLEVAKACSGVNYLVAVLAIGIPLSLLYLPTWQRRMMLLVSAVAIAVAANSLRVALIGVLAYYEIGDVLHGPFHILQGLFVSVVGYGALFVGLWVLSRGHVPAHPARSGATDGPGLSRPVRRVGALAVLVVVLTGLGGFLAVAEPKPAALQGDLADVPRDVGGWIGTTADVGAGVPLPLKFDHELRRRYRDASGAQVDVYIGYLESQTQGKELINYRTAEMHRGAVPVELQAPGVGPRPVVNAVVRTHHGRTYAGLFWYDLNGRVVTDRYWAKAYTMWDALVVRRTNGAMVWMTTEFAGPDGQERALATLTRFAGTLYPEVERALSVSGDAALRHPRRGEP